MIIPISLFEQPTSEHKVSIFEIGIFITYPTNSGVYDVYIIISVVRSQGLIK